MAMNPGSHMIGYIALRRLIGFTGMGLPFALFLARLIQGGPLPGSISGYYYAGELCQSILVGALCAIGYFLSTYRGYDKDYIPVRLAAVFAIGVAFFPTRPDVVSTQFNDVIGIFHGVFAALMFLSLAYISFFLFTKTNKWYGSPDPYTAERFKRKRQRNVLYRVCGIIMAGAIILMPILPRIEAIEFLCPMFWLESITVVSFGISWLVKGMAILPDKQD